MLSSRHRLPKEEISSVLRRGRHVRNEIIELRFVPRQRLGTPLAKPRFAFIVSTKIDKPACRQAGAHDRNRMRRVMSESVRHLLPTLPPIDGIFIAKKNFADFPQTEVEKTISALLRL